MCPRPTGSPRADAPGVAGEFHRAPRSGPIDIPENIINQPTEMDESAIRAPESYRRTTPIQADPVLVSKAAKMLVDAQQPVIHAGSGVTTRAPSRNSRVWRNCSPHR